MLKELHREEYADLHWHEARLGQKEDILRAHDQNHYDYIVQNAPGQGNFSLDGDTVMSSGTLRAALLAVGAACLAVDLVMTGKADNAFCATRPPGHHAEPARPMGFCLFNNIAIAALYAREKYGCQRPAILDFDVHHGNGSQAVCVKDPDLFYGSSHQSPLYPGTGGAHDRAAGTLVNVPLAGGASSREFQDAYRDVILPALREFKPDFVFISAGFDAHALDPLAGLNVQEDDYGQITTDIVTHARDLCEGRVISVLEGGYNLSVLGQSVGSHVKALMQG